MTPSDVASLGMFAVGFFTGIISYLSVEGNLNNVIEGKLSKSPTSVIGGFSYLATIPMTLMNE